MDLNKVQQISLQEENKSCPAQRNLSLVVRIPLDSLGEGKMMLEEKIKKREEEIAKVNTDLVDGVGKMMLEEGKVKVPYVEINKNLMDEGMVEISLSKEEEGMNKNKEWAMKTEKTGEELFEVNKDLFDKETKIVSVTTVKRLKMVNGEMKLVFKKQMVKENMFSLLDLELMYKNGDTKIVSVTTSQVNISNGQVQQVFKKQLLKRKKFDNWPDMEGRNMGAKPKTNKTTATDSQRVRVMGNVAKETFQSGLSFTRGRKVCVNIGQKEDEDKPDDA